MNPWNEDRSTASLIEIGRAWGEQLAAFQQAWFSLWSDAFRAFWPAGSWPPKEVWTPPAEFAPPQSESVDVAPQPRTRRQTTPAARRKATRPK